MGKHRKPRVPSEERPYDIGYGKPPVATQFKPGHAALSKGRPRKVAKTIEEELEAVLSQMVELTRGDRKRSVTMRQAILEAQATKGAKGDTRAADFILRLLNRLNDDPAASLTAEELSAEEHKILEEYVHDWKTGNKKPADEAGVGGLKPYKEPKR